MTITSSMGFPSSDAFDIKEPQFEFPSPLRDRSCSSSNGSKTNGGLLLHGVEMEVETEMDSLSSEFKPIDHPLEPPDEDHPVQCPIPHSSLLNKDGGTRNEQLAENLWKNELPLAVNEEGMVVVTTEPPTRAVRKRHHSLTTRSYSTSFVKVSVSSATTTTNSKYDYVSSTSTVINTRSFVPIYFYTSKG